MEKEEIKHMLEENYAALERYVVYHAGVGQHSADIVQEVALSVLIHGESLGKREAFKPWLYKIARNKLADAYRKSGREFSSDKLDMVPVRRIERSCDAVHETLDKLPPEDKRLLTLCYMQGMKQKDAAEMLSIPLGTLKTRLSAARERFRKNYQYTYNFKEKSMDNINFPKTIPDYEITEREGEIFPVKYEGIIGWGIVPRLGEKKAWAAYDFPEKKITDIMKMEITGKCEVHGIEGVEIKTVETSCGGTDPNVFTDSEIERIFAAQLTDTHCRLLAESHMENGVRKCYTFLDGNKFLDSWGFGENNCGFKTHLRHEGYIIKKGSTIENHSGRDEVMDLSGRFTVKIGGVEYDTVCLTDIESYDEGVLTETYLDRNGNEILWRRFNCDNWHSERIGGQRWSEKYPDNERLTVNGKIYVHWYDCIFDNLVK